MSFFKLFKRRKRELGTEKRAVTLPDWLKKGVYIEYTVTNSHKKNAEPSPLSFEVLEVLDRKGRVKVKICRPTMGFSDSYTIDPETLLADRPVVPMWINSEELKEGDKVLMMKPKKKKDGYGTIIGSEEIDTKKYGLRECWRIEIVVERDKGIYWYDKLTGILISNVRVLVRGTENKSNKICCIVKDTNILE